MLLYSDESSLVQSSQPSMALYVFRKSIQAHLKHHFANVSNRGIPIVFTNNRKGLLAAEEWRGAGYECTYPFSFIEVNSITTDVRDKSAIGNVKSALRRNGVGYHHTGGNADLLKTFALDMQIDVTLHYMTDEPMKAVMFSTDLLLLSEADFFSTTVNDSFGERIITIETDKNISWPKADLNDPAAPGVMDLEIPFRIRFRAGHQKYVPKINNEGKVTLSTDVALETKT